MPWYLLLWHLSYFQPYPWLTNWILNKQALHSGPQMLESIHCCEEMLCSQGWFCSVWREGRNKPCVENTTEVLNGLWLWQHDKKTGFCLADIKCFISRLWWDVEITHSLKNKQQLSLKWSWSQKNCPTLDLLYVFNSVVCLTCLLGENV